MQSKKRHQNHIIDEQGQALLKEKLNDLFVLRDYHPDYGIDFDLELFDSVSQEAIGEHIFIQLKSVLNPKIYTLRIKNRKNVACFDISKDDKTSEEEYTMEVYKFSLDTSELYTIERMGAGVPVLLVLADIERKRCCFVCLNDYIDKIILPEHADDYSDQKTLTINIPILNELGTEVGDYAINWYGKRAKLYAACVRFEYQYNNLLSYTSEDEIVQQARFFAKQDVKYDFWDSSRFSELIEYYGTPLKTFHETGELSIYPSTGPEEVLDFWRRLVALGHLYEDLWREWFLPTPMGYLLSYPHTTNSQTKS